MASIDRQVQRAGAAQQAKETRKKGERDKRRKRYARLSCRWQMTYLLRQRCRNGWTRSSRKLSLCTAGLPVRSLMSGSGWPRQNRFSLKSDMVGGSKRVAATQCGRPGVLFRFTSGLVITCARLEKHALGTTALFDLATGEPDQINAVLDKFDEGKRLTGGEIKAIVSKKGTGSRGCRSQPDRRQIRPPENG